MAFLSGGEVRSILLGEAEVAEHAAAAVGTRRRGGGL